MQNYDLTVFLLTVGDPAYPYCEKALKEQDVRFFRYEVIENIAPMNAAFQEMINRATTKYFIQLDEDMILYPTAIKKMYNTMQAAPDDVGMICFSLWDVDLCKKILGVKIYRTSYMKKVNWQDLKASEMNILNQLNEFGAKWVVHPDIIGEHGAIYTTQTIYLRYKTMYEKNICTWNLLTNDIKNKAEKYRKTGDMLDLFALLGAAHGIIEAPYCDDREKDYRKYNLEALTAFQKLFLNKMDFHTSYAEGENTQGHLFPKEMSIEQVSWKAPIELDLVTKVKEIKNRSIFIWGAGDGGRKTIELFEYNGIIIDGFIDRDNNKAGKEFLNKVIYLPAHIQHLISKGVKPFVIIASVYGEAIKSQLTEMGMIENIDFILNHYIL